MIYEGMDRWNSPSLEHHGVKGMKWGVRKQKEYERKARLYQRKAETGLGILRNSREEKAARYRAAAASQKAANKETTLKRKLQQKYGLEANARYTKEMGKMFESRAKRSKTSLGRRMNAAGAYNNREMSNYYSRRARQTKSIIGRMNAGSIADTRNVPAKSLITNKSTTHGKQMLALMGGVMAINLASAGLRYYLDNKL